ncbi:hypothetical protein ACFV7Q_26955, partial [Streptomyces sp. NPDC059851]
DHQQGLHLQPLLDHVEADRGQEGQGEGGQSAADPDPRLRRLALSDPESTPDLVEGFSRDDSEEVRRDVAEDPRLASATAVRLLGDTDASVRAGAARNPAVPPDVLMRLLTDPVTARDASGNPALPLPVLHRMVELLEREAEQSNDIHTRSLNRSERHSGPAPVRAEQRLEHAVPGRRDEGSVLQPKDAV